MLLSFCCSDIYHEARLHIRSMKIHILSFDWPLKVLLSLQCTRKRCNWDLEMYFLFQFWVLFEGVLMSDVWGSMVELVVGFGCRLWTEAVELLFASMSFHFHSLHGSMMYKELRSKWVDKWFCGQGLYRLFFISLFLFLKLFTKDCETW